MFILAGQLASGQGSPEFEPKPVGTEANLHPEWFCFMVLLVILGSLKGYSFYSPFKRGGGSQPCTPPPLCLLQSWEQRQEVRMRVEILSGSCVTLGKSRPLSGPQMKIIIAPLHKATARVIETH